MNTVGEEVHKNSIVYRLTISDRINFDQFFQLTAIGRNRVNMFPSTSALQQLNKVDQLYRFFARNWSFQLDITHICSLTEEWASRRVNHIDLLME